MVDLEQRYTCQYCDETYRTERGAEKCELEHEMHDHVSRVANVRGVEMLDVFDDIVDWLELSFEYADPVFGADECPRCGYTVHESWMECPGCNVLLRDHSLSGTLACSECQNTDLKIMRKDGVTDGFGVRCTDCGNYVIHGRGVFGTVEADGEGHEWLDVE